MRRYSAAAVGALAVVIAAAHAAEPQYGVCRSQIIEYVAKRFGAKVTRIDFSYGYDERAPGGRGFLPLSDDLAVVYTDGCDGYHVFELAGSHFDCEVRAHYGTPRNYIRYRSSSGECKKAVGGD